MKLITELFTHPTHEGHKNRLNWGAVLGTTLVWCAIALMGWQSWQDRQAVEQRSFDHLLDAAHQVEHNINKVYAANRLLGESMSDLLRHAPVHGCKLVCNDELRDLQKRFAEIIPDTELLVLDAAGGTVAETERDMRQHLPLLQKVVQRFQTDRGALADVRYARNTRNAPSFIMTRAVRNQAGELQAIMMLVQPVAIMEPNFDLPQLGPKRSVTVVDANDNLIIRKPDLITAQLGQRMPAGNTLQTGSIPGSYYGKSPFDSETRLVVRRTLPFALSSGGLSLYLGMSTDDYLSDWRKSAWINITLTALLLLGWLWGLVMMRKAGRYHQQLQASIAVTQKIQAEIPLPLAVVEQTNNTIVRSNIAMIEMFGALAGEGQPIARLFSEDNAWLQLPADSEMCVLEMTSRHGTIHAELHRTALGSLAQGDGPYWLVTLVDVSESYLRTQRLQEEATTDTLTGLANRRHFSLVASQDIGSSRSSGLPLAVLALDIDHFKRVNDQYGHDAGDLVLSLIARIFKACMRDGDLAARMGGEEFAALLPRANQEQALMVAERIRQSVASTPIVLPDGQALSVTISIGSTLWQSSDGDIQDALKRADMALYHAKEQGRNRVVAYAPEQNSAQI